MSGAVRIRRLTREEHTRFLNSYGEVSFLQCPSWAEVKANWSSESLGWVDEGEIVGATLVLYRKVPRLKRYLAYVPDGPLVNWSDRDLASWLEPLLDHFRSRGVFSVKMGPPVVMRRWEATTIKRAIRDESVSSLRDVPADLVNDRALLVARRLTEMGWERNSALGGNFVDYQPRYTFEVPLAGRTLEEIHKGFNTNWRRNITKATRAGVEVIEAGADDLAAFHELLQITGTRDGFSPRPLAYYQHQFEMLNREEPGRMRLYLARLDGEALAAGTMLQVKDHVWYQSGASANHHRDTRASTLLQWQMIQEAHHRGATVYDMRGISDSVDPDHSMAGLTRFKLGTSGHAVEYLGDWNLPLNAVMHKALNVFLARNAAAA